MNVATENSLGDWADAQASEVTKRISDTLSRAFAGRAGFPHQSIGAIIATALRAERRRGMEQAKAIAHEVGEWSTPPSDRWHAGALAACGTIELRIQSEIDALAPKEVK